MNESLMVVAAKYRLTEVESFTKGTWKKNGAKELVFAKKIVKRDFVETENAQANNVLWIIDEEATAKMEEQRQKNIILNAERDQREKLSTADLVEAVATLAGTAKKKKSEPKKEEVEESFEKSETPDETWSVEDLRAYLDEKDISYSLRHGKAKLIELATK